MFEVVVGRWKNN